MSNSKKKKTRNAIFRLLFILLNIGVVWYIATDTFKADTEMRFGDILQQWLVNWPFLIVALVLPLFGLVFEGLKYSLMIHHVTGERNIRLGLSTASVGKYYDNVTPLGSGGQAFQIYHMYKHGIPTGMAGSLSIAGFSMMQIAFTFIAIIVFIFGGHFVESEPMKIAAYVGSVFAIFIPIIVVVFSLTPKFTGNLIYKILKFLHKIKIIKEPHKTMQSVLKFFKNFKQGFSVITSSPRVVLVSFVLSLLYQSTLFATPYFVVRASGMDISFLQLYCLTVFVYNAVAFIPTPGNSGGMEISFTLIFNVLTGGVLFWGMILWRFSSYFLIIVVGLLTVITNSVTARDKEKYDLEHDTQLE